jgi:hypothetical protein
MTGLPDDSQAARNPMAMPVTHNGQQWSNAAEDTIELVEPDPSWPDQFAIELTAHVRVMKVRAVFRKTVYENEIYQTFNF